MIPTLAQLDVVADLLLTVADADGACDPLPSSGGLLFASDESSWRVIHAMLELGAPA